MGNASTNSAGSRVGSRFGSRWSSLSTRRTATCSPRPASFVATSTNTATSPRTATAGSPTPGSYHSGASSPASPSSPFQRPWMASRETPTASATAPCVRWSPVTRLPTYSAAPMAAGFERSDSGTPERNTSRAHERAAESSSNRSAAASRSPNHSALSRSSRARYMITRYRRTNINTTRERSALVCRCRTSRCARVTKPGQRCSA